MIKVAIDQAAKDYWKKLYGEYGESLVRDIPRRIKASLVANKKVASLDADAEITPIASAADGDKLIVEGLYSGTTGKFIFSATLDESGEVEKIDTVGVR